MSGARRAMLAGRMASGFAAGGVLPRGVCLAGADQRHRLCQKGTDLSRRSFLEELSKAHGAGQLQFFGEFAGLAHAAAFANWLRPLRQCAWVVY